LQNEIRKRDELLEEGSEFGGDDDFAVESESMCEEVTSSRAGGYSLQDEPTSS